MTVADALRARKSVRAFTDAPVSKEQITQLLDVSRYAPSGVNTQPWQVAVVTGKAKQRLQQRILAAAEAGEKSSIAYQYYPKEWREPYRSRRKACGLLMYSTLGISREDTQRQNINGLLITALLMHRSCCYFLLIVTSRKVLLWIMVCSYNPLC
jgi:nitroreductase